MRIRQPSYGMFYSHSNFFADRRMTMEGRGSCGIYGKRNGE